MLQLQPWKDAPLKRHTQMSSAALGVSVGYFTLDIALIIRHFPWVRNVPDLLAVPAATKGCAAFWRAAVSGRFLLIVH